METRQNLHEGKPYLRHSEIPKEHEAFIRLCDAIHPEGECENCYLVQDYELWLEQWEDEGGSIGPHYDS